jgi:hypothetical protein
MKMLCTYINIKNIYAVRQEEHKTVLSFYWYNTEHAVGLVDLILSNRMVLKNYFCRYIFKVFFLVHYIFINSHY